MSLYEFILSSMLALADTKNEELARYMSETVQAHGGVGEWDEYETASVLVAIAYRESKFNTKALGDHGRSKGAFQALGAPKSILENIEAQTELAYENLYDSVSRCPNHPLAIYARGTCSSQSGRRISSDRMRIAKDLLKRTKENVHE